VVLLIFTEAVPSFFTVVIFPSVAAKLVAAQYCGILEVPTYVLKPPFIAFSDIPSPLNGMLVGLVGALLGISNVAERAPLVGGAKATLTVQDPLGAIVLEEQESALMLKAVGFVPLRLSVPIFKSTLPLLEMAKT
jgi:hypothetical protein